MATHNQLGAGAEDIAAAMLERQGWTVLHRNWRWRRREVDLIARRGPIVAFVEVRARRTTGYGHPLETIGWQKRRWLEQAAFAWVGQHGRAGEEYRFDAISVYAPAGDLRRAVATHIEAAWTL